MRGIFCLLAVILLVTASNAAWSADAARIVPADEAATDLTWLRFKSRLMDALARRDRIVVLAAIDPAVRNVSGRVGVAEFRRLWNPQSADSPLWVELPRLLQLGGIYVHRPAGVPEFCAPYVRYKWPDSRPGDQQAAIVTKDVLLKAKPSALSNTLLTLNHEIVSVLDWETVDENIDTRQKWVRVQIGKLIGYVPEEQIRSPLEYHACFRKSGADWRMTAFGVGE